MGRSATGSVRIKRGKWLASLRGEHLGSFATEQEAWHAVEAEKRIDEGRAPDSLRIWGAEWLDERELSGDVRGIHQERSVWRQHILTADFIDWPLRRVRPADVQRWLNELPKKTKKLTTRARAGVVLSDSGKRIGKQTVKHARRILAACFRAACVAGKVTTNPVDQVLMPKMAAIVEDDEAWSFLTLEEIDRLFAALSKADRALFYCAWYAVAIYGGLRLEEIKALRWEDIRAGELRVRRAARVGTARPLKAASSRRNVPMLRPLREALAAWQRDGGVVKSHGLVFPADHGSCYGDSYDAAWETQWRTKANVRPHVRFHDLRHTCGSHLVMGSWGRVFDLIEVRDWLGHSDIQTTQRYAKLGPDSLKNKVAEMESRDRNNRRDEA